MDHNTNIIVTKEESKMQMQENEIVLYQPNDAVHLEVRMANESVWLTQSQIALLFGVGQPAISKHLNNIFKSGELDESSVHSILEYTAADGVSAQIYTRSITPQLALDLQRHNAQYRPIAIDAFQNAHDRFLCIDDTVYHIGASLKDLGKKWFAFSRMEVETEALRGKMGKNRHFV